MLPRSSGSFQASDSRLAPADSLSIVPRSVTEGEGPPQHRFVHRSRRLASSVSNPSPSSTTRDQYNHMLVALVKNVWMLRPATSSPFSCCASLKALQNDKQWQFQPRGGERQNTEIGSF